jgi:hypothetical protein
MVKHARTHLSQAEKIKAKKTGETTCSHKKISYKKKKARQPAPTSLHTHSPSYLGL